MKTVTVRKSVRVVKERADKIDGLKKLMHIRGDSEFFNRIYSEWYEKIAEPKWRNFLAGE